MINEFLEVFQEDLLGVPPKREIDFEADLLQDIHPTFVTHYRMAKPEHKELKDLLGKWFI